MSAFSHRRARMADLLQHNRLEFRERAATLLAHVRRLALQKSIRYGTAMPRIFIYDRTARTNHRQDLLVFCGERNGPCANLPGPRYAVGQPSQISPILSPQAVGKLRVALLASTAGFSLQRMATAVMEQNLKQLECGLAFSPQWPRQ